MQTSIDICYYINWYLINIATVLGSLSGKAHTSIRMHSGNDGSCVNWRATILNIICCNWSKLGYTLVRTVVRRASQSDIPWYLAVQSCLIRSIMVLNCKVAAMHKSCWCDYYNQALESWPIRLQQLEREREELEQQKERLKAQQEKLRMSMGQIGEERWREGWRVEGVGGEVRGVMCGCKEREWWKLGLADGRHYACTSDWKQCLYIHINFMLNIWEVEKAYLCCACKQTQSKLSPTTSTIFSLPVPLPLPPLPSPPISFWFFVLLLQICLSQWMAAPHT